MFRERKGAVATMKKAASRLVAQAIQAGWKSGAAVSFLRTGSGRRLAVKAPSPVLLDALGRKAGRIDTSRGRDARAPRISDWGW